MASENQDAMSEPSIRNFKVSAPPLTFEEIHGRPRAMDKGVSNAALEKAAKWFEENDKTYNGWDVAAALRAMKS